MVAPSSEAQAPGGVGAWVGCFAGAGYGLAVGVGAVKRRARFGGLDFVSPLPARVIVHDGALAGAYCGVGVGVGVGRMLAFGWGIPMPMLPHVHMPKIAGVPRMEDGSVNPAAAFAVFAGAVGNAARSVRNGVVGLPLRVFARIRAGV